MAALTLDTLLRIAQHSRRPGELKVSVPLHSPGRLGGRLLASFSGAAEGFDWEQGHFILAPTQPLIGLEGWEAEAISSEARKLQSPAGYAAYKRIQYLENLLKENDIPYERA